LSEHAQHGPTAKNYMMVFAALLVLTTATVLLSYTGMSHTTREIFAFGIAAIKAVLVALIFMHLRYEKWVIAVFAIVPVVLAFVFILAISPDIGVVR